MDARLIYVIVFACLFFLAIWLQKRFCIICDATSVKPKPYSYSRLQLLWWTFLVFASFISILIASGTIPTLDSSTLILLGIGALTTASARIVDISDEANQANNIQANNIVTPLPNLNQPADPNQPVQAVAPAPVPATPPLSKNKPSQGFWLDILSDNNGISIHRLQALVFNLLFGTWFIYQSILHLKGVGASTPLETLSSIMPVISKNNLILLGLSAGTYVALKTTENK
ncbi:hypothetical protein F0919_15220 [Taibaiella lutea]|uniref:Uncharacterized protein n=1 Tax=Taibaiella lutea TaxID=2608001 RepID=A0A5M6CGA3_9BACT|nr:hypothetical protein [Taibaiella lutea]KAA5532149.1 hypothetical protein F0919_15220 [Taibaiella lutea]